MALINFPNSDIWTVALAPLAGWPDTASRPGPGWLTRSVTRYLTWRARRETVRILSRLDRATLRDLGISDIESAVYGDPEDRMRGYDQCWWHK